MTSAKYPRRTIALGPPFDDGTVPGEPDPTPAEVYANTRRFVAATQADGLDEVWTRGARYVMERADDAIAERDRLIESILRHAKFLPNGELREDIERAMALLGAGAATASEGDSDDRG